MTHPFALLERAAVASGSTAGRPLFCTASLSSRTARRRRTSSRPMWTGRRHPVARAGPASPRQAEDADRSRPDPLSAAGAHSISRTDAEWERVRVLAERRGLSVSRYFVECGLNMDPTTEAPAPPRLVLDGAEQRRLHDTVVRIAERTAAESEEAVLMRISNALAFLVETRKREMVRDAREYELKALLTDLFGEWRRRQWSDPTHAWALRAWTSHDLRAHRRGVTWKDRRGRASSPCGAPASAGPAAFDRGRSRPGPP